MTVHSRHIQSHDVNQTQSGGSSSSPSKNTRMDKNIWMKHARGLKIFLIAFVSLMYISLYSTMTDEYAWSPTEAAEAEAAADNDPSSHESVTLRENEHHPVQVQRNGGPIRNKLSTRSKQIRISDMRDFQSTATATKSSPHKVNDNIQSGKTNRWLRVVFLEEPWNTNEVHRRVPLLGNSNSTTVAAKDENYLKPYELPFHEHCTPMEDWQKHFYTTCNTVHELDLIGDDNKNYNYANSSYNNSHNSTSIRLLSMQGFWRMVWKVSTRNGLASDDIPEHVVLKMLHLHQDFSPESFRLNQIDAIAMERLSSSPYIVDEYAFCGQTVMTEYGTGEARSAFKDNKAKSDDRLLFARQLARGLDAIHSLDHPRGVNATFAHNDVNIANMVVGANGKLKYNDFNIGVMLRMNGTRPCGFPVKFGSPLWRSPEEILNQTYVSEKVDIYSLGNVLFQVLTKHQPWTWLEPDGRPTYEEVLEKKSKGEMPFLPEKYVLRESSAGFALQCAIAGCFQPDPAKRPTAYQLAKGFEKVLKWRKAKTHINVTELMGLFSVDGELHSAMALNR